ncbi:unnamed protein product [Brassica rapa]|uniref:26S proteasome non-ATPase regulatory subunit 10 n=1 Tax=Brassica campestris TaxID=3711 RepID=A0A8D9CSV7_BRACM|nr:unnamed protein product [Brassica rapa]
MEVETDASKGQESKQIRDEELFKAAESGDSSVFMSLSPQQLVKSLSFRNEDGRSLLHVSASFVKLLSSVDESKTVINGKDDEGWAPLHSAASIGKAELVEILLTRGLCADVNVKNNGGRTALHYAASKGWLEIAQLLLTHGAKINITDKVCVGCTPLHRAASTGKTEVCEFLIEEGAEIDAVDKMGQTPLMHSVICDDRQVAFLLVRHGAVVDVEDKEGYTVLGRATNDFRPALIDAAKAMLE